MSMRAAGILQKIGVWIGVLVLLFGMMPVGVLADEVPVSPMESYERMAENAHATLWADPDTGLFALENKATGKRWMSTPSDGESDDRTMGSLRTQLQSQVVIRYIYKEDELDAKSAAVANSQIECVDGGHIRTSRLSDGLRVDYDFADIGVKIPVTYRLTDDYLEASVVWDEIETDDAVYLMSIQLLPAFGANGGTADGYLLIPDGCGALIRFDNGIDGQSYESMIYGNELTQKVSMKSTQTESVRLPVFGIHSGNDGLFAIVTQGDASCSVVAYNRNSTCNYDAVSSQRILRQLTEKTIYETDPANRKDIGRVTQADMSDGYCVRYYWLSGDAAEYSGMAGIYRNYLTEEHALTKVLQTPTLALDIYGAMDKQASFFGIPYTKTEKLTTFAQAETMLESLHTSGIDRISVRFCGWTNSGLLNQKKLTKATPLSLLGGKKGLARLDSYMHQQDVPLYLDADLLQYRRGSKGDAVRTSFEQIAGQYRYLRSVYSKNRAMDEIRLLSPSKMEKSLRSLLPSYGKLGQQWMSLSTLGSHLYSNFSADDTVLRSEARNCIIGTLKSAADGNYTVAIAGGNAFAVACSSRLYDVPTSSSQYDIFDTDVPFYQIVFHGYRMMCGTPLVQSTDWTDSFLRTVESGCELHYSGIYADSSVLTGTRYEDYYSSTYTLWQKTAAEQYAAYMSLLDAVYDQTIVRHEQVAAQATRTVYADGTAVLVNYADEPITYDGKTVEAKSFAVAEGGAQR